MKRKDLKLALVCYGGVSLAVYMHGVTKEILKLVRASKHLHDGHDVPQSDGEWDSEAVYLDLLRAASSDQSLRVIVDVIAGASAGGLNGIMLARALVDDRPLDAHRRMWLEMADAESLLEPTHASTPFSKIFMRPFLWLAAKVRFNALLPPVEQLRDPEIREKVSRFTRSRWFRPPFSGAQLTKMLLDGLTALGSRRNDHSLVPYDQRLDLFVTVTDFYGHAQSLPMHNPARAVEREHRHIFSFRYAKSLDSEPDHDFVRGCFPALAFAGRATASFPGAFPAARLGEMDGVLKECGKDWPQRDRFLSEQFADMIASGEDPMEAAFIDGSVLNNKPFAEAIDALKDRAADREVDRRIVYIDPDPGRERRKVRRQTPGFFQTIRGALSDIPRTQPIRDELERMDQLARRMRRLREAVTATDKTVQEELQSLFGGSLGDMRPSIATISAWRREAHDRGRKAAGYAYESYQRLKSQAVLDRLIRHARTQGRIPDRSPRALVIESAFHRWASLRGVLDMTDADDEANPAMADMPWIRFLRLYDMAFRRRRLHFVIRRINQCYRFENSQDLPSLDALKVALYQVLGHLSWGLDPTPTNPTVEDIDHYLGQIAATIDLQAIDDEVDHLMASEHLLALSSRARAHILGAYLGFPFYDVVTLPLAMDGDIDAFDDIKVDRISPEDATALTDGQSVTLKGMTFGKFGGFFSRRYREHDYLWGRLNAAERLVDIVADAAPDAAIDRHGLKRRLMLLIIDAERPHLAQVDDVLDDLQIKLAGNS